MKILALESATKIGSVALLEGEKLIKEVILDTTLKHSEKLLPAVLDLLKKQNLTLKDIDAFACDVGPGSFTGLRAGLALVKGFAFATGKPIFGVSSLEALAQNEISPHFGEGTKGRGRALAVPMLNAFRGEVYTAVYQGGRRLEDERAIAAEAWIQELLHRYPDQNFVLIGDGAVHYADPLQKITGARGAIHADPIIHAGHLGRLAWARLQNGSSDDLLSLIPRYLRAGVGTYC